MIKSRALIAGSLLALAGVANAGVTVTPALVTDYDWRGIDQTDPAHKQDLDAAFQMGITYNHPSGFYVGTWGSNVDFGPGDPNMEVDFYAGYTGGDATKTFAYDVGVNAYTYPGCSACKFYEIYGSVTKGWFMGKIWFSPEFAGTHTSESAVYVQGDVNVPMPMGLTANGHVGYSFGSYWTTYAQKYVDYSVGVTKALGPVSVAVKYVNSNDLPGTGRNAFVGSISTTLPWAKP